MSPPPEPLSRRAAAEEETRRLRDEIAILRGLHASDRRIKARISALEAQLQRRAQKLALYREIDARRERFDRPVGLLEGGIAEGGGELSPGAPAGAGARPASPETSTSSRLLDEPSEPGAQGAPGAAAPPARGVQGAQAARPEPAAPFASLAPPAVPAASAASTVSAAPAAAPERPGLYPAAASPGPAPHASDADPGPYFRRVERALWEGTGVYTRQEARSLLERPRDFLGRFRMPATLYRKLRGYQQDGVKWLLSLYHMGRCGLLADEPGLGKTVQAITFLQSLFLTGAVRAALLVSPATLMRQWAAELHDWAPFARVVVFTGSFVSEASAEAPAGARGGEWGGKWSERWDRGQGGAPPGSRLAGSRSASRSAPYPGSRLSPYLSPRLAPRTGPQGAAGMRYAAFFDALLARQAAFAREFDSRARNLFLSVRAAQRAAHGGAPPDAGAEAANAARLAARLAAHAGTVFICSYEFAVRNSVRLGLFFEYLERVPHWYSPPAPGRDPAAGDGAFSPPADPQKTRKTVPCAIFDEIHYLKNAEAGRTKALRQLPAAFKLGLSGTPIQNDFSELYSLLSFLSPGLLGDAEDFKRRFDWPIKAGSYAEASVESIRRALALSSELYNIIRPYILRRLKVHVERELPSKTEYLVWCKLGSEQERVYCNFLAMDEGLQRIRKLELSGRRTGFMEREEARRVSNLRMTKLVELQQICDHPLLLRVGRVSGGDARGPGDAGGGAGAGPAGPRKPGARRGRGGPSRSSRRTAASESGWDPGFGFGLGSSSDSESNSESEVGLDSESDSDSGSDSGLDSDPDSDSSPGLGRESDASCIFSESGSGSEVALAPGGPAPGRRPSPPPSARAAAQSSARALARPARPPHPGGGAVDFTVSSKLMWLRAALRGELKTAGNLSPGEKALVFCQGQKMLGLVEGMLASEHLGYVRMDGSTPMESRGALVDRFSRAPECRVFLLTTRVGGLGLNLVAARKVYVVNPSWNPAVDDQAMDRCWRIKQEAAVEVYRLLTAGTVEEKMYNRQVYKKAMSNKLLENVLGARGTMTRGDLYNLFRYTPPKENITVELVHIFNGKDQTGNIILDSLPEELRRRVSVRRGARAGAGAGAPREAPAAPGPAPAPAAQKPRPLGYITFLDIAQGEARLQRYLESSVPRLCGGAGEAGEAGDGEGGGPVENAGQVGGPAAPDEPLALFDLVDGGLDQSGEALRVARRTLELFAGSKTNDADVGTFEAFFEERVRESSLAREDLEEVRDALLMRDTGRGLYYVRRAVRQALLG